MTSYVEQSAEFKRIYMKNTWNHAYKYLCLKGRATRRLHKFPLWKRALFFWKFSSLSRLIGRYDMVINMDMSLAMKLSEKYMEDLKVIEQRRRDGTV